MSTERGRMVAGGTWSRRSSRDRRRTSSKLTAPISRPPKTIEAAREIDRSRTYRTKVEMPKRRSRVAKAVTSKSNVEQLVEHTPAEQLEHVIADLEVQS